MREPKYKTGDRVVIRFNGDPLLVGQEGVIEKWICPGAYEVRVLDRIEQCSEPFLDPAINSKKVS